jgi:hypothetical protein
MNQPALPATEMNQSVPPCDVSCSFHPNLWACLVLLSIGLGKGRLAGQGGAMGRLVRGLWRAHGGANSAIPDSDWQIVGTAGVPAWAAAQDARQPSAYAPDFYRIIMAAAPS